MSNELANRYIKRYGSQAAASGHFNPPRGVVPTGILALDYALGVGGWPKGHISTVFGPRDIGKSSVIGLNAIKSVQKAGEIAAIIAVEPSFDPAWAEKHGVDLDKLIILWPDDGQEAFDMLYDTVMDDEISLTLFDSIGKVQRPSEAAEKGKASQGGASALISWGVSRILTPCWKREKTVLFLNQVRDDMGARFPLLRQPGGHALEHSSSIIVQLKPGKDKYTIKEDGNDIVIGRELVAVINRNKADEGTGKRAKFDFYQMETDGYPFGIDVAADVVATGKRTGVLKGATWLYHDQFPDGKLQGKAAVAEYLSRNPTLYDTIRNEVLKVMESNRSQAKSTKPDLKVANDE